jgi:hypothetical protein
LAAAAATMAAAAEPMAAAVPSIFNRHLSNEELVRYLDGSCLSLGQALLPHATGDLLCRMDENGMDIKDAFSSISGEQMVKVLELKLLLKSLSRVSAETAARVSKSAKAAGRKAAQSTGNGLGKGPIAPTRPWDDIVALSKTYEQRKLEKGATAEEAERRKALEKDGLDVTVATPKLTGLQSHHLHLLGVCEDDLKNNLASMRLTLVSFVPPGENKGGEITFHATGGALSEYFAEQDKETAKIDLKHPIKYQQFWGRHFVTKARDKAMDKEGDLIRKNKASVLESKRDEEMRAVEIRYAHKIREQEVKLGKLASSALLAPSDQRLFVQQQAAAQQLLLEGVLRERESKKTALGTLWADRITKRSALDAERKRKSDSAQHAIDEGKQRKVASVQASEAMAAAALKAANAAAAAMANAPVNAAAAAPVATVVAPAAPGAAAAAVALAAPVAAAAAPAAPVAAAVAPAAPLAAEVTPVMAAAPAAMPLGIDTMAAAVLGDDF